MPRKVFISHGWHDRWLARQIAENVRSHAGADVFIDVFDIQSGDRIEQRVRSGLNECDELVSLLTPWSVDRNWVWTEMAAAWVLEKRYVGVMYGITLSEIEREHGGLAVLTPTNAIEINDLDRYLLELRLRTTGDSNG